MCDFDNTSIVFIKNNGKSDSPSYDIVNFNLANQKISALTENKTISNIINMDGTLLTLQNGKYFIVKGEVDYKNIDTLKAKSDAPSDSKNEGKDLENE